MSKRTPLTGPSVWLGSDIIHSRRWIRDLPPGAAQEIDAALQGVKRRGLEWSSITKADFPRPRWRAVRRHPRGARGRKRHGQAARRPGREYSEDELRQLYFGIGQNLGTPVYQNRSGELMRFIRDEGAHVGRTYGQVQTQDASGQSGTFLSSYARTLTNNLLRFHTDRTDVVGLLCVRQAKAGGVSRLCSTGAIHNAILAKRPDLLDVLFEDFYRSRLGEESKDPATVYRLPIFGLRDGRLTSHYSLTFIEAAEMVPGVPKLTPAQREAIDMLMATAEELAFEMTLEPGDLQLINSHVTYHGRTAFTDEFESGHSRLLMRLWLTMPNNRALPQGHEVLGARSRPDGRGGIAQVAA